MTNVFSMNDIRGHADDSLTTEYVWNAGKALAEWLPEDGDLVIVKAQGAHEATAHALVEGALLQGRDVVDAGTGDRQKLIETIGDQQAAGGALVSHDDLQNLEVVELFDGRGVAITADIGLAEIDELVEAGNFVPAATKGNQKTL